MPSDYLYQISSKPTERLWGAPFSSKRKGKKNKGESFVYSLGSPWVMSEQ